MGFLNRWWSAIWGRLRAFVSEEESDGGATTVSPPPELEGLRQHAVSLCVLAAQTNHDRVMALRHSEEMEARVKELLQAGEEEEARESADRLETTRVELAALTEQYELQRKAADSAVTLYRRREEEWRKTLSAEDSTERLERALAHADALERDLARLPAAEEVQKAADGQLHTEPPTPEERS